jgi:hypothetical protein
MGSFVVAVLDRGYTLSAEKNFCGLSSGFLFVFWGLFVVWLVFWVLFSLFLGAHECWLA